MKKLFASLAITALIALPISAQEQSSSSAGGSAGGASGGAAGAGAGLELQTPSVVSQQRLSCSSYCGSSSRSSDTRRRRDDDITQQQLQTNVIV